MADFTVIGHISNIKFHENSIYIFIDEYEKGYVKSNGVKVEDKVYVWKVIFSGTNAKRDYINKFFSKGVYVQVKGKLCPYELVNGETENGYTVFGQTINIMAYPKRLLKVEREAIKLSQNNSKEQPNLDAYMEDDF